MMRYNLVLLLLASGLLYSCATTMQDAEPLTFQKSVNIKSSTEDINYNRAIQWVCDYYHSPKDVINFYDREAKVLVINGMFKFRSYETGGNFKAYNGYISYAARMYFDGVNIKIVFSNFKHTALDQKTGVSLGLISVSSVHTASGYNQAANNTVYKEVKIMIDDHIHRAMNDFTQYLTQK